MKPGIGDPVYNPSASEWGKRNSVQDLHRKGPDEVLKLKRKTKGLQDTSQKNICLTCTKPKAQSIVQKKIELSYLPYIFLHTGDLAKIKYFQTTFFGNNQQSSQKHRICYNQILFELKENEVKLNQVLFTPLASSAIFGKY